MPQAQNAVKLEITPHHSQMEMGKKAEPGKIGAMEQQLIERAKSGDQLAFKALVTSSLPKVMGLAMQMLGNQAEAEDLAQEVMLSLWQNIDQYDPEKGRLTTWTYRITANRCLDRLRQRKVDQLDEDYDEPVEADQYSGLFEKQVRDEIGTAMADLPERQQLALTLFHHEGHSMQEIAEILDASVEAVESLLARARRNLKKTLQPLWQHVKEDER